MRGAGQLCRLGDATRATCTALVFYGRRTLRDIIAAIGFGVQLGAEPAIVRATGRGFARGKCRKTTRRAQSAVQNWFKFGV
jgi:hypothetical protein